MAQKNRRAIALLKSKISQLIKLAACISKYIIQVIDLETKLESLLKQQLGIVKRKVAVYSTNTQQVTFVGSWERFSFFISKYPEQLKRKVKAFWVNVTTSEVITEIAIQGVS